MALLRSQIVMLLSITKRLNDDKWYRKFEPYIVEYNLKGD